MGSFILTSGANSKENCSENLGKLVLDIQHKYRASGVIFVTQASKTSK